MALISCPECSREISDRAISCPHCGFPLAELGESESNIEVEVNVSKPSTDDLIADIISRQRNNKVEVIKDVKATLGVSLIEAKKMVDEYFKNNNAATAISVFKSSKVVEGVSIDYNNHQFKYGLFGEVYSFDDIIRVEIYENGSSLTSTNTASMVGRAAVGSLVNPVGTIIGGVTAKKKSVDVVKDLKVLVTTKKVGKPLLTIPIKISKNTKKDSKDYAKAIKKAQEIEATINALTYR